MNDTMRVQATLAGIAPERFDALRSLGITVEQFGLFGRFSLEDLEKIGALGIEPGELTEVVQRSGYGIYNIITYGKLRAHGIEASEIEGISGPSDLLQGIEAGLSRDDIRRAMDVNMPINSLINARKAEVSFADMFAAHAVRKSSSWGSYLAGRKQGYSHDELIAILRLTPSTHQGFEIDDYEEVRLAGVTHAEVLEMLQDERVNHHSRDYYVEYVTEGSKPLSHPEAYELVIRGIYPSLYRGARLGVTHPQIIEALDAGISIHELEDIGRFLADNCRITYEEVLQYRRLCTGLGLFGINSYLKLLDAGFSFDDMLAANEAGITLHYFTQLRNSPLAVTQNELLEIARLKLEPYKYIQLRQEGITHDTIIENVRTMHAS